MLSRLLEWMSSAGEKARLSVLIFHRVLAEPDPLFPAEMDARRFDALCGWLTSWFNVLSLDQAVQHLKAGTLPARAACLTFDDGYADNYHVALPILQRHGLRATFFIATGFLDGGCMWNDVIIESIRGSTAPVQDLHSLGLGRHASGSLAERRTVIAALIDQVKYRPVQERIVLAQQITELARVQLPAKLMMTSGEVKAMRNAGMQIGAHTVSHPILARLPDAQARQEIQESQHTLERLLDERVGLFAYPNGKPGEDYTMAHVGLVRSLGFDAAVSTRWGASGSADDLFQIRRFTPWDQNRLRFGARIVANLSGKIEGS